MLLTVTSTSTSIKDLIIAAWYDFTEIEDNRIKQSNSNNSFWVYIANIWINSIFLENIYNATIVDWFEIISEWDFSIDVYELSKLNLLIATWTQTIKLIIT